MATGLSEARAMARKLGEEKAHYIQTMTAMVTGAAIAVDFGRLGECRSRLESLNGTCITWQGRMDSLLSRLDRKEDRADYNEAVRLRAEFAGLGASMADGRRFADTLTRNLQQVESAALQRVTALNGRVLAGSGGVADRLLRAVEQGVAAVSVDARDKLLEEIYGADGGALAGLEEAAEAMREQIADIDAQLADCADDERGELEAQRRSLEAQLDILEDASARLDQLILDAASRVGAVDGDYRAVLDEVVGDLNALYSELEADIAGVNGGLPAQDWIIGAQDKAALLALVRQAGASLESWAVESVREQLFEDRFGGQYQLKDGFRVKPGDAAAIAVMRLELGDAYFSAQELADSQSVVDKYNELRQRYPTFPIIIGNDKNGNASVFFGGNQDWFKLNGHYAASVGGCGPVAAANLLANLAFQDQDVADKLGFSSWNGSGVATMGEYLCLMEDVYSTVTPMELPFASDYADNNKTDEAFPASFGIFDSTYYQRKVREYASGKGIELTTTTYDTFWSFDGPYDLEGIQKALDEGRTVSFLNALSPLPLYWPDGSRVQKEEGGDYSYDRHWVDVVAIDGDKIYISSWGREYYVYYSDLKQHGLWNPLEWINSMVDFELAT